MCGPFDGGDLSRATKKEADPIAFSDQIHLGGVSRM